MPVKLQASSFFIYCYVAISYKVKKTHPKDVFLAGVEGLEPSRTVLETGMLPLHHTPMTPKYFNTKKIKSQ